MALTFSPEVLEKVRGFLSSEERVLVFDRDIDGVTAASLLMRFFPSYSFSLDGPHLKEEDIELIESRAPKTVIFADLAIDQDYKKIMGLRDGLKANVIIIDHHIFEKDLNSNGIAHINPRLQEKNAYLPTAFLVYKLLEALGEDPSPHKWIASIGVVADHGCEGCEDFLKKGVEMGVEMISAAITLKGERGIRKVLDILSRAKSMLDLEKDPDLRKWASVLNKEIERILEEFEFRREFIPELGLFIFEIKSKLSVAAVVSTLLAEKYPEKVIIVRKKSDDGMKLSMRNQSGRVDLNDIVRKCVKGIGSGGGHEKAAGGMVSDWKEFKRRFINHLELHNEE
jgi:single-stranded DNA-specific DHH superfamily exonuclease